MRQVFLSILLACITFGLIAGEASARGFSGSRGFGMIRSKNVFTHAPHMNKAKVKRQTTSSRRWRGALTGLLLGSLITSLFMNHGLGSALFSWLILGTLLYFVVYFFRRKKQGNN